MKKDISKQKKRVEKKKKKLAALANLIKMNDQDRRSSANNTSDSESDKSDRTKKANEMNRSEGEVDKEPQIKKLKVESEITQFDGIDSNASSIDDMKLDLTKEQYIQIKRELRERKRTLQNISKFHLREIGRRACLEVPQNSRTPIFLTDVQHLLMSALIGKTSPCSPERWCFLEKPLKLAHTLVLILDGLSLYHYLSNESRFEKTNKIFEYKLEVVLPPCQEHSIIQDLATVPLTNVQAEELIDKHGCLETAMEMIKDPTLLVKSIFPVEENNINSQSNATDIPPSDKFPRTKLLLSALQMVDEGYPMPLQGELQERFKNFVFTKEKYVPVSNSSPMFGIDCEMCRTSVGFNELTRVSIVNEQLETIYETLVMPTNKIIDYLTKFSGITPELMNTVTKKLAEVQADVRRLLPPDAILIGQSLNSDLNAMQMMHPYVIDTSIIFNLTGVRRKKSKLQTLARTFLDENIQENTDGHDSVEDSLASMKLVKMKLANNLDYGDTILTQKKRFNEIIRAATSGNIRNNIFAHAVQRDKRTAIITTGKLRDEIKTLIKKTSETNDEKTRDPSKTLSCFELDTNKDTIKKTKEIVLSHSLTIANLIVGSENFQLDRVEKTISKIDKWIGKLWKSTAHNGMFLVLMGGSSECPRGSVKIAIKKNVSDVTRIVPITA